MRTSFVIALPDNHHRAFALLSKVRERVYEIDTLSVPQRYRGRGYGRKLLREVCENAAYCGALLRLVPLADGGLTTVELEAWYIRHGFVQRSNGYFYREPLAQAEV